MASRKSRSRKKSPAGSGKKRPARGTRKPARAATPRKRASPRRKPAAAPAAAAPPSPALAAARERLGLRRGEDMALAARHAEEVADEQRSRDDVHERDLSGS